MLSTCRGVVGGRARNKSGLRAGSSGFKLRLSTMGVQTRPRVLPSGFPWKQHALHVVPLDDEPAPIEWEAGWQSGSVYPANSDRVSRAN